jgi:hypothetical protein
MTMIRTALLAAALLCSFSASAQSHLKQSTASQIRTLGPFLDPADGTAEGGLTIDAADVRIKKNGAADVAKNSGGCTHDINGAYHCTFDATDTDTVGEFQVSVCETGAVCVHRTYWVYEEAVYDMLFGASALGYIANAPVNVAQFGGSNGTFSSGRPEVNTTHWAGTAVGSATVNANMTQISGDSGAADELELAYDGSAGAVESMGIIDQGTAQSATGTTLVLRAALGMADDTANGMTLVACGSTQGYCQSRTVDDYTSATDTATVSTWTVTPSGTITYYLYGTAPGSAGDPPTAAEIVNEWEAQSQADPTGFHVNVMEIGGTAQTANDNGADINEILTDTGTTLQGEVDGIQADTENIQTRIPAALNNGVMPADVQRINDVEIVGDGSGTPFDVP